MVQDNKRSALAINRRRILQAMGAAGIVGAAGCLSDDNGNGDDGNGNGDDGNGNGDDGTPDVSPGEDIDFEDIIEGGTLRAAVGANVDSFDPPYSSDTTSTMAQGFIYESLLANDSEGNLYPWLAESYELVETNDVDRTDYEPYMRTVTAGEDGALDVEEQILITHEEDAGAEEGEEVRILTTTEAPDAIADGVFGMHYRYDLEEGVMFHNGEEMTSADVVASYRRYENSQVSAQTYDSVLHVEADGDYTVHIYAQIPDAEGERELPGAVVIPEEHADLPDGGLDPREGVTPIGTGPYELEEFEDEQYFVVTKNENYWVEEKGIHSKEWFDGPDAYPDGPVIDEIDVDIVPDNATRSAALQNDEIDITYGLNAETLDDFNRSEDFFVAGVETGGYEYFQYPVHVEPWDDQRLRQAVNHLVPRQSIVDNVLAGFGRPAWTSLPELAAGSGTTDAEALEEELRPMNEYDPERAEELLEEVVDDLGLDTPIEIQLEVNADNDDRVRMTELVAEAMEQTGYFETTIETYEWNTYVGRVLDPEYAQEGHIACIGLSGTFNPHSFCEALHHQSNHGQCCNLQGVGTDELDEMMDGARYGTDVAEDPDLRRERYDEIWHALAEYSASSITHFDLATGVTNTDVRGFSMWPFNEGIFSFALYSPTEEQVIYLERDE
ncbi:ABC transporter substrate-binding protein [Natrononativus amylolyticus]|uniref:ABC transporter substrate-binding protein n=1 Tax=Natrononativus amylolyticus TaxID=2963434 RepID=UPI0020CDDC2E|nr:ABC transporter substrate-binding protein [Natrononativus amylolyticus]